MTTSHPSQTTSESDRRHLPYLSPPTPTVTHTSTSVFTFVLEFSLQTRRPLGLGIRPLSKVPILRTGLYYGRSGSSSVIREVFTFARDLSVQSKWDAAQLSVIGPTTWNFCLGVKVRILKWVVLISLFTCHWCRFHGDIETRTVFFIFVELTSGCPVISRFSIV